MKSILKSCLIFITVVLLFSCQKSNNRPKSHLFSELGAVIVPDKALADADPQNGPGGSPLPEMSESSELLLKIMLLIDSEDPTLVLTEIQKKELLPELMEWKEELDAGHDSVSSEYIDLVSRELSIAQNEYKLKNMGPPRPERGDVPQGSPPADGKEPEGPPPADGKEPEGPPPGMAEAGGPLQGPPEPPSDTELLNDILKRMS